MVRVCVGVGAVVRSQWNGACLRVWVGVSVQSHCDGACVWVGGVFFNFFDEIEDLKYNYHEMVRTIAIIIKWYVCVGGWVFL